MSKLHIKELREDKKAEKIEDLITSLEKAQKTLKILYSEKKKSDYSTESSYIINIYHMVMFELLQNDLCLVQGSFVRKDIIEVENALFHKTGQLITTSMKTKLILNEEDKTLTYVKRALGAVQIHKIACAFDIAGITYPKKEEK